MSPSKDIKDTKIGIGERETQESKETGSSGLDQRALLGRKRRRTESSGETKETLASVTEVLGTSTQSSEKTRGTAPRSECQ